MIPVQSDLIECQHHKFASLCPEAHCAVRDNLLDLEDYEEKIADLEWDLESAERMQDDLNEELKDYELKFKEILALIDKEVEEGEIKPIYAEIVKIIERY